MFLKGEVLAEIGSLEIGLRLVGEARSFLLVEEGATRCLNLGR